MAGQITHWQGGSDCYLGAAPWMYLIAHSIGHGATFEAQARSRNLFPLNNNQQLYRIIGYTLVTSIILFSSRGVLRQSLTLVTTADTRERYPSIL